LSSVVFTGRTLRFAVGLLLAWVVTAPAGLASADAEATSKRAAQVFGALPAHADSLDNPYSEARVDLGRMLFFDTRLSKNHDVSCNSCHDLASFGQDNQPNSPGHRGQRGGRSSPTVYNAALHLSQFWDGRAADVEAQAKGPILNPIEMAMPSEEATIAVLHSIPGYVEAFAKAFPGDSDPVTYDNLARAIGAFERRLLTPGPFDDFMSGKLDALDAEQVAGVETFMTTGCITCHMGPAVGGALYQKLGLVEPYDNPDTGRFQVTGDESHRQVFKVPSLRNITETGPYFHDGSVPTLDEAIRLMAKHQLGKELDDADVRSIAVFLGSLKGRVDAAYTAAPELPANGPDTPAPDPS
jgi:cytochrome c peroxidase